MLKIFLSYSVHLFTVSGVVFSFFALLAVIDQNLPLAFFFLAVALFIDGVDGSLARIVDVKRHTPNINGENLDNIIDFLNYVFIPAFIVYWLKLVPEGFGLVSACLILIVSCYTFANNKVKTSDFFFSGFPAIWNVVVLYFYLLKTDPFLNLIIIAILSFLTFIPIKYLHPFRVKSLRKISLTVLLIWMITTVILLYFGDLDARILNLSLAIWSMTNFYFIILTILRTFKSET